MVISHKGRYGIYDHQADERISANGAFTLLNSINCTETSLPLHGHSQADVALCVLEEVFELEIDNRAFSQVLRSLLRSRAASAMAISCEGAAVLESVL
jgi:hypothetical protein